jgi:glycosyltransferase involved in cell wall biosynthesis
MKVLWLNHRDPLSPRAGGAERTILEVVSRLLRRGHAVTVLTGSWAGAAGRDKVKALAIRRYPGPIRPHIIFPLLLRFGRAPDVVIDDLTHVVPGCSPYFTDAPGVVFFRHLISKPEITRREGSRIAQSR